MNDERFSNDGLEEYRTIPELRGFKQVDGEGPALYGWSKHYQADTEIAAPASAWVEVER